MRKPVNPENPSGKPRGKPVSLNCAIVAEPPLQRENASVTTWHLLKKWRIAAELLSKVE
jgi:hypothetical protein